MSNTSRSLDDRVLKKRHLISGLIGMICPVPIIGEVLVAGMIYPLTKEIPLFREHSVVAGGVSLITGALARSMFYSNGTYQSMIEYCYKMFS